MSAEAKIFKPGSLVVYKTSPAKVVSAGAKIEIVLADGRSVSAREKDIVFLHPGPAESLALPEEAPADIEAAWEICRGETTTLAAFAEILYGSFTPRAALGVYALLLDGLYVAGAPDALRVLSTEEREKEEAARQAKKRGAEERAALLERIRRGKIEEGDRRHLAELEVFALGKSAASRALKELGIPNTPEAGHGLLLKLGVWDYSVNPYISRLGFSAEPDYPPLEVPAPPEDEDGRLDLTGLPAYAIDDEGSDDPDDAVSFDNGKIWVHIADPASLVKPGSAADIFAREAGATRYLPEKKSPMLPPQATAVFGLGLREVSPALSFCVGLNEDGSLGDYELRLTKIRAVRMTYTQADESLAAPPLAGIYELTRRYQQSRLRRGGVNLQLPDVKIRVYDGKVTLRSLPQTASQDMVSGAMLLAGEAAARFCLARGIPAPYAGQEAPDSPPGEPQTLAEMYECRKKLRPSSVYSSPSPHFGLGLDAYCRVTSPLRRYLDLVLHQQLRAFLTGGPLIGGEEMTALIGASEALSPAIQKLERLSNLHWTLVYLLQNPGWTGRGVVVEKRGRACTLLLPELGMETKLNLRDDIPLNTEIALKTGGVDLPNLTANFDRR